MVDSAKYGSVWNDEELDLIIADYFSMLGSEIAARSYVKSKHSAVLMERIGRSHRSVEFKHQNISAVLEELGLPWIRGYSPKRNYQNAIFAGIDRYLSGHAEVLTLSPAERPKPQLAAATFVPAPTPSKPGEMRPPALESLVRKFDPVARDHRNRALGKAGEAFVLDAERTRLEKEGRHDLARQVRWVADEDGDGAGYDISSFNAAGERNLIEVKTTNGGPRTPFFLSNNELSIAQKRAGEWQLYRVHQFLETPRIFIITPPLETSLLLRPESWRASF